MNKVVDWIDLIRSPKMLDLPVKNPNTVSGFEMPVTGDFQHATSYERFQLIDDPNGLTDPPVMLSASNYFRAPPVGPYKFHTEDPAPTVRAGNLAWFWGTVTKKVSDPQYSYDPIYVRDSDTGIDQRTREYKMHGPGEFPTMIEAIGLQVHFHHDRLQRKGRKNPAISVKKLIATWGAHDRPFRKNGPIRVSIDDYQEFWKDGKFKGFVYGDYHIDWGKDRDPGAIREFLKTIDSPLAIFSNRIFTNPQDEVIFISEFN